VEPAADDLGSWGSVPWADIATEVGDPTHRLAERGHDIQVGLLGLAQGEDGLQFPLRQVFGDTSVGQNADSFVATVKIAQLAQRFTLATDVLKG